MLNKIQLEAARVIAGAERATSAVALDMELFLLPIRQQPKKRAHEIVRSICSGFADSQLRKRLLTNWTSFDPTARTLSKPLHTHQREPRKEARHSDA
jgi:hypothetical protein